MLIFLSAISFQSLLYETAMSFDFRIKYRLYRFYYTPFVNVKQESFVPRYETLFSQTTADDSTGNLRYQRVCCYFESPSRYGLFDTAPYSIGRHVLSHKARFIIHAKAPFVKCDFRLDARFFEKIRGRP